MDPSPPRDNEEWPTPTRRTTRMLRRYARLSYRQIERSTGGPQSTAHRHAHYDTSRTYRKRGRKSKLSTEILDKIIQSLLGHYKKQISSWNSLVKKWNLNVFQPYACSRICRPDQGYHKCKACQKGYINPQNLKKRFEFAVKHVDEPIEFWKRVVFTDECHFERNNKSVDFAIRAPGERFCADCIQIQRKKSTTRFSV